MAVWFTPALFAALALLFAGLALRDRARHAGRPTPARRTWTRMAIIFAVVSVALAALHLWRSGSAE